MRPTYGTQQVKILSEGTAVSKPHGGNLVNRFSNIDPSDLSSISISVDLANDVENIADMWVIESSGIYKGHYHILGGTLPLFEGKNNKNGLLIDSLINRVKKNSVKEVILATSASVEGETTSHYIADSLKDTKAKITRLAKGVPVGGEIEFLDDGTLFSAFKNRAPLVSD